MPVPFYTIGQALRRFEHKVFDDYVDAVKDGVLYLAREIRSIQAGKVQEYALLSLLIVCTLTVLIILIVNDSLSGLLGIILN